MDSSILQLEHASLLGDSVGIPSQVLRAVTGMEKAYFASENLFWVVLLIAIGCIAMFWWSYHRAAIGLVDRVIGITLKSLAVLALMFCVLEPMNVSERAKEGDNWFLILADDSKSLLIKDRGERLTRADKLKTAVSDDSAWQTEISEAFDVRRFQFDSRLNAVSQFDLSFEGNRSSLDSSLADLSSRFRNRPVAGILIFTDGNASELAQQKLSDLEMPPLFPVVMGKGEPERDLRLTRVSVSQTNFEASPVKILAEFEGVGHSGGDVVLSVVDSSGNEVATQRTKLQENSQANLVRFQIQPKETGILFYRVTIRAASDDENNQTLLEEATLENNQLTAVVDRGGGPYRVLYISGRPNWEYKFLRRSLQDDLETDMVGLLRIARREPKFSFRSRPGESTNPLFRGFEETDEETEQYDQPVFLRVDTEEQELREGFPKIPSDLMRYDAIILDDVDASFFTHEQMQLLNRFVSERGGGLMMLGGLESFSQGKFQNTPVEDLLPVYLSDIDSSAQGKAYQFELARDGWLQPWARLRKTEREEQQRLATMPKFFTVNATRRIKPGAEQIATVRDTEGDSSPALVTQTFGRGRTAALLVGDMWRWEMQRPDYRESDLQTNWRQLVRWLVADVPKRVEVDVDQTQLASDGRVQLKIDVRDEEFKPYDNGSVSVRLVDPEGRDFKMTAEPSDSESGSYSLEISSRNAGPYKATVNVVAEDGSVVGVREVGWTAEPDFEEFRRLAPNRQLLQTIASQSGGEVVEIDDLSRLVRDLPNRPAPITETVRHELWHRMYLFVFAIGMLACEWGFRRIRGLP